MSFGTHNLESRKIEPVIEQVLFSKDIDTLFPCIEVDEFIDANELAFEYYCNEKEIPTPKEMAQYDQELDINVKVKSKNLSTIYISQSIIKMIIDKNQDELPYCARYIHEVELLRNFNNDAFETEAMTKGKYFETLFLGSCARGDKVIDLPRKILSKKKEAELKLKNLPLIGEKTIDQIRIDQQAERLKMLCEEYRIQIIPKVNTQIKIKKKWNDRVIITGELDIFPTPILYEGKLRIAIIDIKLTTDVHNTWGDFCWGSPEHVDMIQGDVYQWLIRDIDFDLNPHLKVVLDKHVLELIQSNNIIFLYWIFGYKKEPLNEQERMIERRYRDGNTDIRQQELFERIRKTISCIERDELSGFKPNPKYDNCKNCPVNIKHGGYCREAGQIDKL